jgi:tRNA (guanine-N7-)-methyltransferase
MPHLKVTPFDTAILDSIARQSQLIDFVATATNRASDKLLAISHQGERFFLQLKCEGELYLLKYEKVTRPMKVSILKEALGIVASELALEVRSSNIAHASTKPPLSSTHAKKIEDFVCMEYPFERVSVEVGFGSGRHLLYQAKKHPKKLFIGLEIHTPSAQQVLKQIELQGLENLWIVNYDARLFLEMLPSNLCDEIFVHFPVPWDKKPHRRVIGKAFLEESMRVLKKGGRLELRTDSDNYFWYALETFFASPKIGVEVRKNEALEVTSKYEARWLRQEKDIYDLYVTSQEESPQSKATGDFNFNSVKYSDQILEAIPPKAIVYTEYFIHFERTFRIEKERCLIKCAFGSFDRPEHKYLLIDSNGCGYFNGLPITTRVNFLAHQKIVEQLARLGG